jgi:nicotinate-nucleotide adenylyltransferase
LREVNFLILARPGVELDWNALPPEFRFLRQNVVPAPLVDISATDIRRRVQAGESIDELAPPPVAQYIRDRGLYR